MPLNWENWQESLRPPFVEPIEIGDSRYLDYTRRRFAGEFAGEIADQILGIKNTQAARVGLSFAGKDDGHAVAAARTQKEFMFFDPNGGLIYFQGEDCAKNFRAWFSKEFIRADRSFYDRISSAKVFYFQLSKGRLPNFELAQVTELPHMKPGWAQRGKVESYDEYVARVARGWS